ncbi:MAG: LytTR family DNA-binding domain-containing protein [Pseudomonadota bacterium]
MTLSVLVVDDEAPARERLAQLLTEIDDVAIAGSVATGEAALAECAAAAVDCVLLDIRMPGMDGLETALKLARSDTPPAIVFTTAYDQYAIEAFETEAVGYLLKPVRIDRLRGALDKAARLTEQRLAAVARNATDRRRFVTARRGDEVRLIAVRDIAYFEADQKYVRAWHSRGEDLIDDSLRTLEAELTHEFVRIHRKLLVSLRHIESVEKTRTGGTEVQLRHRSTRLGVSRRHVMRLRERLKNK